jgi:hypothetical protein
MSKLVTLDEVEEYERELRRAHAENRAPALRDPHDVHADNLGNADHHLEEVADADAQTAKLHKEQKDVLAQDKKQLKVIRDNSNRLPDGEGSVGPYEAPDPDKKVNGPRNSDESEALDNKVQADYDRNRAFDDSFADSNIPNLDENGQVKGDSVNRVFTRKMSTFSPEELVRENRKNEVPVPDRYKTDNPPGVVQQSNPVTGEPPTPETSGYVEGYKTNNTEDEDNNGGVFDASDVPLTAISTPWPEHVIGDETGTTREPTKEDETDVHEAGSGPEVPKTVPLTEGQVLQGKVKRPDHFNPPDESVADEDISQGAVAATLANLPPDTTGLRGENDAHKAVQKSNDENLAPGNVDPVNMTDEQKEYAEKQNNPGNNPDDPRSVFAEKKE